MVENMTIEIDIAVRIIIALITILGAVFAAVWGARAGVRLATSKETVEERAKAETKERIKIENEKKIIESITSIRFAIDDAKYKISISIVRILNGLDKNPLHQKAEDIITSAIMPEKGSIERGEKSIRKELREIENFIFLLEADLRISGEDSMLISEINKLKEIQEKMQNVFNIEEKGKTIDEIKIIFSKLLIEYSICVKGTDEEVKGILLRVLDIYIKRLK